MVAANAWPARIARDGTLYVNTSSSTWAFELGQLAPAILEQLHQALGKGVPKALKFVPGHLPEPAADEAAEARTEVPEPTEEALQTAAVHRRRNRGRKLAQTGEKSGRIGPLPEPVRPPFLIH